MSALARLGVNPATMEARRQSCSESQRQTRDAFGFKWSKRESYESEAMDREYRRWLFEKYCDNDPKRLDAWLREGPQIILDAGCGAGSAALLLFGDHLRRHDYLGVDISRSIDEARRRFREHGYSGDFLQCDLLDIPIPDGSIDMILSEGVLHHTDNTERAIRCLAAKIKPGGRFLFYVYAKKAVIREFTDDLIREHLRPMSDEQAWEALKPLTRLGQALGELNVELDVPEDIPYLGIKKGKVNLQRFCYYNILKAYYRPDYSLESMNHINFDWFRPLNCHRHTKEEVVAYCAKADLAIEHLNVQESGIAVVARKQ